MSVFWFVLALLLGAYAFLFAMGNTQEIALNLGWGEWQLAEVQVWQLALGSVLLGLIIGCLLMGAAQLRTRRRARSHQQEVRRLHSLLEEERKRLAEAQELIQALRREKAQAPPLDESAPSDSQAS